MNNNKRYSIRTQLLLWLLLPILVLLGLSIGSNYYLSRGFINTAYDEGLEKLASMLAGQVEYEEEDGEGEFELASPALTQNIMEHYSEDGLYYLILGPKGEFIAGDRRLEYPLHSQAIPEYRNRIISGQKVRAVAIRVPFYIKKSQQPAWISVWLGENLEDRGELIGKISIMTVAQQLVLILLAVACVWLGVTQGLQPLAKISQAIEKRTPAELDILDLEKTPDEIHPLMTAINDLLFRIQSYLAVQRRFVANTAHQLRTPMAGLQTQVELLMRQELPESAQHTLSQIQTGLNRSTHLLHQMLSLSRVEPDALKIIRFKPVNLTILVSQVAESFVPFILEKNIDFGVEAEETPVWIMGDENSLHDLLSNLIDNALLYTPCGGQVMVHLEKNEQVILSVEDSGPGIPESERLKVFERFYRLSGQEENGSGLGLSIVQEITQAHHAKIQIKDSRHSSGSLIEVVFILLESSDGLQVR